MAKKPDAKRAARLEKSNRNTNRAAALVVAGFCAEAYLLFFSRYYVDGVPRQVAKAAVYLETMRYAALALTVLALAAYLALRKRSRTAAAIGPWVIVCAAFLCVSSFLMRAVYPGGTTAMCVAVPVAVLIGIAYLLYPHEFFVQLLALAMALFSMFLGYRSAGRAFWTLIARVVFVLALLCVALLAALSRRAQKNDGVLRLGKTSGALYTRSTNYRLLYGIFALCAAAMLLSLFVPGFAFYGIWALAVVTFALAVYFTVKQL